MWPISRKEADSKTIKKLQPDNETFTIPSGPKLNITIGLS
jgi:hypothetical protein